MIKPGIKIGPRDWRPRLTQSGARYCEVWFRVDKLAGYTDMFAWLKQHRISAGLHFWAVIADTWEPNIAYPGATLKSTLSLIKQTIDIAAKHHFHYVNIHSGNRSLFRLNLDHQIYTRDQNLPLISSQTATATQRQSLIELNRYAQPRHILLLVETVGAKMGTGSLHQPQARLKPQNYFTVPVKALINLARNQSISITNDFCHTFADKYDQPLQALWQALWSSTQALAPDTKLLHINTVVPPFNGSDSHHGITANDFKLPGIFPTRLKLKRLLSLFKNRPDVWAITEPFSNHVANYQALVQLLKQV